MSFSTFRKIWHESISCDNIIQGSVLMQCQLFKVLSEQTKQKILSEKGIRIKYSAGDVIMECHQRSIWNFKTNKVYLTYKPMITGLFSDSKTSAENKAVEVRNTLNLFNQSSDKRSSFMETKIRL